MRKENLMVYELKAPAKSRGLGHERLHHSLVSRGWAPQGKVELAHESSVRVMSSDSYAATLASSIDFRSILS